MVELEVVVEVAVVVEVEVCAWLTMRTPATLNCSPGAVSRHSVCACRKSQISVRRQKSFCSVLTNGGGMNREKKKCECFIETKKYLNKRNQGRKRTVHVCASFALL